MIPTVRESVLVRRAAPRDLSGILTLIEPFVATGDLLPRTPVDVLQAIDRTMVATDEVGRVVGVGSIKWYGPDLGEVRALAIDPTVQAGGVGRRIVMRLIDLAWERGVGEVFALTRQPGFFVRLGFGPVDRDRFPSKIWDDCERCPRREACDEVAVHVLL